MQLREEAWTKIQDFNGVWIRDLGITGAMLYQLSCEATDIGSRSIECSYVPVKEMSVNDIWNKTYMNCGNDTAPLSITFFQAFLCYLVFFIIHCCKALLVQ